MHNLTEKPEKFWFKIFTFHPQGDKKQIYQHQNLCASAIEIGVS